VINRLTYLISHSVLPEMKNISDKRCREPRNTHCIFNNLFFPRKSRRLWDNMEKCGADHRWQIWGTRIACWIPKATNTHKHNMQYSLLFHINNSCTNTPQCYVIRTLPVLLLLVGETCTWGKVQGTDAIISTWEHREVRERSYPVTLCPPHISPWLTCKRTRAGAVTGWQLTASAITQTIKN
jgi:hypothetical protein